MNAGYLTLQQALGGKLPPFVTEGAVHMVAARASVRQGLNMLRMQCAKAGIDDDITLCRILARCQPSRDRPLTRGVYHQSIGPALGSSMRTLDEDGRQETFSGRSSFP